MRLISFLFLFKGSAENFQPTKQLVSEADSTFLFLFILLKRVATRGQ